MNAVRIRYIVLLSFPVLILPASAQEVPPAQGREPARPELRVGLLQKGFRLDGKLDEPAWAQADSLANLTEIEPTEGGLPTGRTVVKVLADRHHLVFGIVAYDPDPSAIVAFHMRRDASLRDEDHVRIVLDPFLDGRSGVVFMVNPNGARHDALVSRRGEGENSEWDQVWDAKGRADRERMVG